MVSRKIKETMWSPGIKTKNCGFQGYKGNKVVSRDRKEKKCGFQRYKGKKCGHRGYKGKNVVTMDKTECT